MWMGFGHLGVRLHTYGLGTCQGIDIRQLYRHENGWCTIFLIIIFCPDLIKLDTTSYSNHTR